jgi:hypothetical protein
MGHVIPAELPADDVVRFCVRVSAGEIRDIGAIANELRELWQAAG